MSDVAVATDVAAESTAVSTPEAEAPAEATKEVAASLDSELSAIWKKANPTRDEGGKFKSESAPEAAPEGSEAKAEEKPVQAQPEVKEPPKEAIQPPQSWTAEARAKWESLPPDLQSYLARRESESHKAISQQGEKIKALEPLSRIVEQGRATFEKYGLDVEAGITQLLRANDRLETDPANAIREIAQHYGVDLNALVTGVAGQHSGNPETAALKAHIANLERKINETHTSLKSREQADAESRLKTFEQQVAEFAKDKADFTDLVDDIQEQIVALRTRNPDLPPQELLQTAYERARKINPDVAAKIEKEAKEAEEKKRLEEAKKRAAEAKKAAPLNLKSLNPTSIGPKTMDDTLREIAAKKYRGG